MMPIVSVLIPTYNRAHCLERAVRSVQIQTFRDWELIVVDDGSTDSTARLWPKFRREIGDRFRHVEADHRGVSAARNRAIAEASGSFIAFLDSDDYFLPEKLSVQMAVLSRNPDLDFIFSNFWLFDDSGALFSHSQGIPPSFTGRLYPDLLEIRNNFIVTPSVVVRRDTIVAAGGFDETMAICEDIDLWRRICRRGRGVGIYAPLTAVHWRRSEAFPFARAISGRSELYRRALAADPTLRGAYAQFLFGEMFQVFSGVAAQHGRTDLSRRLDDLARRCAETDPAAAAEVIDAAIAEAEAAAVEPAHVEGSNE